MSHFERWRRLYICIVIFVTVNAQAAAAIFGSLTHDQLYALGRRDILIGILKCMGLAGTTLLTYLGVSPKPVNPNENPNPPVPPVPPIPAPPVPPAVPPIVAGAPQL
jgi:hypothetical protein